MSDTLSANTEVFPEPALKVRLMDQLVRFFPRRLFAFLRPRVEYKYAFHPLLLTRKPLADDPDLPAGYRFCALDERLLAAMMSHKEALPEEVYRSRLAKGDLCYCLEVEGKLVTYQWLSSTSCAIFRGFEREIVFLALTPAQAFTYDFYTYRDCRKKGYGSLLKKQVYRTIAEKGITEVMSCVLPTNRESRNIHMREGFTVKALPYNYRIMDWSVTLWGNARALRQTQAWWKRCAENLR